MQWRSQIAATLEVAPEAFVNVVFALENGRTFATGTSKEARLVPVGQTRKSVRRWLLFEMEEGKARGVTSMPDEWCDSGDATMVADRTRIAFISRAGRTAQFRVSVTRDATAWDTFDAPGLFVGGYVLGGTLVEGENRAILLIGDGSHVVRPTMLASISWGEAGRTKMWSAPVAGFDHPAPDSHLEKSSVPTVVHIDGRTFVQIGMLWRGGRADYAHLTEILSDGSRRFVAHLTRGIGQFTWDRRGIAVHDVAKKKLFFHDLAGALVGTLPLSRPELSRLFVLGAGEGRVFLGNGSGKIVQLTASKWLAPGALPPPLAAFPAGGDAHLGLVGGAELAPACPEPVTYEVLAAPQNVRFERVQGWILNEDPEDGPPSVSVLGMTDAIVGFYRVDGNQLRLVFNFLRAAITAVECSPLSDDAIANQVGLDARAVRIEISTPSGRTVLIATEDVGHRLVVTPPARSSA